MDGRTAVPGRLPPEQRCLLLAERGSSRPRLHRPIRLHLRGDPGACADARGTDRSHRAQGARRAQRSGADLQPPVLPAASGRQGAVETTRAVLSASDLGSWALSQFATVAEVKAALADQPIVLEALALLGGVVSPFHYVVHDAAGASLVIEFDNGKMTLYDNPVGVMTNGPNFSWHLTNLDNYTHLSNVDRTTASFGDYKAIQPDSGIATAGLPASGTSVGRFVRAAYYAQFTERAPSADEAVQTLAHVMNNFDRPRGVTIDYPQGGAHVSTGLEVAGLADDTATLYATEFTSWTNLSDLARKRFFIRAYKSLNYTGFDLAALASLTAPKAVALAHLDGADGTARLLNM
ncbi:MAG: linear amide C-N hydrolase [Rhodospirillales bacterium]|nr:linear amide C-N hydrolase [Rhodospirillales bacterium]